MMRRLHLLLLTAVALVVVWIVSPHEALSHGAVTTTVYFDREIVRILNNRCVMCHMDGGLSFPLSTYEETWVRGRSIRTEVLRRHMPPWPAVAGYGRFANDNGLTLRETQFLVSWVEGLGPRNGGTVFLNVSDPKAAPRQEVRASAHVGHWQLGEPDLARSLEAGTIAARQPDGIHRTTVDLGLTSAGPVSGVEYQPADRRIVRGAVFTVQQTGQWLGSWTPWYGYHRLPAGAAITLPAGARIVAEIHYRGTTEPVVDRGTLGVFFADRQAAQRASDLVMDAKPDGEPGKVRGSVKVAADTRVWALRVDLDRDASALEVSARRPDGGTDVLLFARNLSTEWPTPFVLEEPHLLRKGTELRFTVMSGDAGRARAALRTRLTLSRF
ncbi:MAG TPA: hypothetical protein VFV95_01300 [Vicinamibacterales bacterium]|nr:hypothetical protein [Vicinamibacterales bacterium]